MLPLTARNNFFTLNKSFNLIYLMLKSYLFLEMGGNLGRKDEINPFVTHAVSSVTCLWVFLVKMPHYLEKG